MFSTIDAVWVIAWCRSLRASALMLVCVLWGVAACAASALGVVSVFGRGCVMSAMRSMMLFSFVSCAPIARFWSSMTVFMLVIDDVISASCACIFCSAFLCAIAMFARPELRALAMASSVFCC